MEVYILTEHYPYEATETLGVYKSPDDALIAKEIAIKHDDSCGYNVFDIKMFEVE